MRLIALKHAALTLLLLAAAPAAHAASCQISVSDLVFGAYRFDSPVDVETSATISLENCAPDERGASVAYSISVSPGHSGSFGQRLMIGSGGALAYNLYADAAYVQVWGDGTGGSVTLDGHLLLPGLTSATHVVHGRIPARQTDIAAGLYADVLTITITY